MTIGLHDADKDHRPNQQRVYPNYALMKISAYHKSLGDTVKGGTATAYSRSCRPW